MNFKITSVYSWVGVDNDDEKLALYWATKRGYKVSALCLQDNRAVQIFVPASRIRDMEEIKTRLKRKYERDLTDEHEQRERVAQEKIREIEESVTIANLIGVVTDP